MADLSLRARLLLFGGAREQCEAGALVCYANNITANFKASAVLVDHVLRGAHPAELPMSQASIFEAIAPHRLTNRVSLHVRFGS